MYEDKYALKDILVLCQLSWRWYLLIPRASGHSRHEFWARIFIVAGMDCPCGAGFNSNHNNSALYKWEHLAWKVGLVIHKLVSLLLL